MNHLRILAAALLIAGAANAVCAQDVPKTTPMDTLKDAQKDAMKDAQKDAMKDVRKDAMKDVQKDAMKDAGKTRHKGGPGWKAMQFDADKAVMIDEAGMVVTESDGKIKVEFIAPKDRRPKETAGLDIAAGDEIGMAAGKKITSIRTLRDAYESTKPGEEFKLGLRRDGQPFIVTFKKMDEKDLPKRMIIRKGGGDDANHSVLPALGVALGLTGGRVVIMETFPNAPKEMVKGDVIVSLNGSAVKTLDDFSGAYDRVEVGGELKFGILRDGKAVTVVTKRNKPQGKVIIR